MPTDQSRSFRRQMISNTLDKRFHQPIEIVSLDELEHPETSEEVRKRKQKAREGKAHIMRDPFEFIQFFKRHVYHEVADEYHDFLEDLKILRENHIMIKGHERASGKNFVKLGQRLRNQLQKLTVI